MQLTSQTRNLGNRARQQKLQKQTAALHQTCLHLLCSAIDKLDKESWEAVRAEMVDQKGLPAKAADAIGRYVRDDVEPKFQGQPEEVSLNIKTWVVKLQPT